MILKNVNKNISSSDLKKNFSAFFLKEWSIISVSGIDATLFLQNQLTIDIISLPNNTAQFCALCNVSGKVLTSLTIFRHITKYYLFFRSSVKKIVVDELKKYSIFSKVLIIDEKNLYILGIVNKNAENLLKLYFKKKIGVMNYVYYLKNIMVLNMSTFKTRYLIIINTSYIESFKNSYLIEQDTFSNNSYWLSRDIEFGYPIIEIQNVGKFLPQSLNLCSLNGINYNKGCYKGQEVISITKFRKKNKKKLSWIIGKKIIKKIKIGDILEVKKNKLWYNAGVVLTYIYVKNQLTWIQAVLNNNYCKNMSIRLKCCKFIELSIVKIF